MFVCFEDSLRMRVNFLILHLLVCAICFLLFVKEIERRRRQTGGHPLDYDEDEARAAARAAAAIRNAPKVPEVAFFRVMFWI